MGRPPPAGREPTPRHTEAADPVRGGAALPAARSMEIGSTKSRLTDVVLPPVIEPRGVGRPTRPGRIRPRANTAARSHHSPPLRERPGPRGTISGTILDAGTRITVEVSAADGKEARSAPRRDLRQADPGQYRLGGCGGPGGASRRGRPSR